MLGVLDCYHFIGEVEFMTFTGKEKEEIAFNLVLAPDADDWLLQDAAKAIATFLMDQKHPESDMLPEDE